MHVNLTKTTALGFILTLFPAPHTISEENALMTKDEIKRMLSESDDRLLSPEVLDRIERREYPFVRRYLRSSDPDIRNVALSFVIAMDQPWTVPLLFAVLRDNIVSHRAMAADALIKHVTAVHRRRLYDEIARDRREDLFSVLVDRFLGLLGRVERDPTERISYWLVLALGKAADASDIPALRRMLSRESDDEVRKAYQMALARCGDPESAEAIRHELDHREPEMRREALDKVIYIADKEWIPHVAPLLLDESKISVMHFDVMYPGDAASHIFKRVCDFALDTIIEIDVGGRLTRPEDWIGAYPDEVIQSAREVYGVSSP